MFRLATLVAVAALMLIGTPIVTSAQAPSLNWGSQVNPARCPTDQGYRYLEINVTRKVDDDYAFTNPPALAPPNTFPRSGAIWAIRDFNQHIQVWRVGVTEPPGGGGAERFCALVRYQGSFTTQAGPSPAGTDQMIAAGTDGSFEGGYLLVFNADEKPLPLQKTQGHIGTLQGPIDIYDWRDFYFMNMGTAAVIPQWWGWIYHGGNNGAWVNSIGGDQGDITD
jgi:hypothetical protein